MSATPSTSGNGAVRLKPGALLSARPALEDPDFAGTIVLVCRHASDGAYGLVLNRPSHMPLREIFEHPPDGEPATRRVYIGGPVQPTELQILQLGDEAAPDSMEIVPGVHMGGRWETLEDILAPAPEQLRLFLGYSGWGEGQLEEEIAAGAWDVWDANLRHLLETPEEIWATDVGALQRFLGSG